MRSKVSAVMVFTVAVALVAVFFINPLRAQNSKRSTVKVVDVKKVELSNGVAEAVMIYRANGMPLSVSIRANNGVVVCMHYNLDALQSHKVPAASVQGIKSIDEALATKIVHVNVLAEKLGVHPGMPVMEALEKMM